MILHEIWVYVLLIDRKLTNESKNLLKRALYLSRLSGYPVCAVVSMKKPCLANELTEDFKKIGARKILTVQSCDADCAHVAFSLYKTIIGSTPEIFLFDNNSISKQISAHLACLCSTGLTADCVDLQYDGTTKLLIQVRHISARKKAYIITPVKRPQIATVSYDQKYDEFVSTGSSKIEIINIAETVPETSEWRVIDKYMVHDHDHKQNIHNFTRVMIGGAGLKNSENFDLLKIVAKRYNAGVGATRAAVDMGLISEKYLVGISGRKIKPCVCITFGVSGSFQHMLGIRESQLLIAVNNDDMAVIHTYANYSIFADAPAVLRNMLCRAESVGE